MAVMRGDWKTKPMPAACEIIPLDRTYSPVELATLIEGHLPKGMEDKWFAYYEEPFLYFHRSWSGFCIYRVRFEVTGEGGRVSEVLVNRDTKQYPGTVQLHDGGLVGILMDDYVGRDTTEGWERLKVEWERQRTDRGA